MSHELRTPLNAIIGFSDSMKEEIFGPLGNDKYREYLSDIHHSGQHLLELINDILDLSAFEANALRLHEDKVSIPDIISSTIRILKPRADRDQIIITTAIDANTTQIYADERRVRQIIINLLNNAVKFTAVGGRVTVHSWENEDGSFSIAVSDTGIGMDDGEAAIALSVFGQVDSGHDSMHEGTGLGLPLTKGLMELHGGTLEIESEKGHGTLITVNFPRERVVHNSSRC